MKNNKALYILGGMGPEASIYLYKLLIDSAIKDYKAKHNNDFPEIILHSVPVPDFISDDKSRNKALGMLEQRVRQIKKGLCISIACNTAHILLSQLQKNTKIPFVSMIDETAKQIHAKGYKKIGLLATPSTLRYSLYQNALNNFGISTLIPSKNEIKILEQVIRNVLKGEILSKDTLKLKKIAYNLQNRGSQAIILGCTELPLVFPKTFKLPVYNSLKVLAQKLLQIYYEKEIQITKQLL